MSFFRKIIYLLLSLSLLLVYACRSDRQDAPDIPDAPEAKCYLELAVSTDGGYAFTRANPTAGENGDGLEHGRGNENKIHNLSIFVYLDEGEGLDGDYEFIWSRYADDQTIANENPDLPDDCIYYVKIPIEQEEMEKFAETEAAKPRAVVVANAGNLTNSFNTTSQLRKSTDYGNPWISSNGVSDYFVMATAFNGAKTSNKDGIITVKSANEDGLKYDCKVSLERVAARIDLEVTDDNIKGDTGNKYLQFQVTNTEHSLKLKNAIPVNMMQENSFLLKHVSNGVDNTDSGWLCAGDETTSLSGEMPTNYVMTPAFSQKPNAMKIDGWYGTTAASVLRNSDDLEVISKLDDSLVSKAFQFAGASPSQKCIVLTYAKENTQHLQVQTTGTNHVASDYLSGLLLRAQYHPASLYTSGEVGQGAPTQEYKDGDDFWLFRTVKVEVAEASNLYFASKDALDSYVATLPAGGKYETQKYDGGICYYNLWIKHANIDETDDNFPMKYGIVRNNIYRIRLSFGGIGQPTPDLLEPYNVTFRVYVKKWNFRLQPEIVM